MNAVVSNKDKHARI